MASMCDQLLRSNNTKELERFLMFRGSNDIHKLERVLSLLPESNQLQKNESVLKARANVAFHVGDFKEVYSILQSNIFSKRKYKELQDLWCNTLYSENEKLRGRGLLSYDANRYLRLKYPLPMTIWDGKIPAPVSRFKLFCLDLRFVFRSITIVASFEFICNFYFLNYRGLFERGCLRGVNTKQVSPRNKEAAASIFP